MFVVNEDVLIDVVGALRQRLGSRVRDLRMTQLADLLVLHGRTNNDDAKKMAQTLVVELAEQFVLLNEIVVL